MVAIVEGLRCFHASSSVVRDRRMARRFPTLGGADATGEVLPVAYARFDDTYFSAETTSGSKGQVVSSSQPLGKLPETGRTQARRSLPSDSKAIRSEAGAPKRPSSSGAAT